MIPIQPRPVRVLHASAFVCDTFIPLGSQLRADLGGLFKWGSLVHIECTKLPCTRGKVIGFVIVIFVVIPTRITRSGDLGTILGHKCHNSVKNVEKVASFAVIDTIDKGH